MPILEWHDSVYAMGVEAIDGQHRRLVEMINRAHDAAAAGDDPGDVRELVDGMAAYAREHFETEERLMAETGYRGHARHRDDHAAFTERARAYAATSGGPDAPDPGEVFRFLAEWLSAHILEVDMAFGRYLREENSGA